MKPRISNCGVPKTKLGPSFKIFSLIHQENKHFLSLIENNSGVGASGYGVPGPTWDRGANLKDYYSRKEEQEVQAVRLSPYIQLQECDLGLSAQQYLKYLQLSNLMIVLSGWDCLYTQDTINLG